MIQKTVLQLADLLAHPRDGLGARAARLASEIEATVPAPKSIVTWIDRTGHPVRLPDGTDLPAIGITAVEGEHDGDTHEYRLLICWYEQNPDLVEAWRNMAIYEAAVLELLDEAERDGPLASVRHIKSEFDRWHMHGDHDAVGWLRVHVTCGLEGGDG